MEPSVGALAWGMVGAGERGLGAEGCGCRAGAWRLLAGVDKSWRLPEDHSQRNGAGGGKSLQHMGSIASETPKTYLVKELEIGRASCRERV